MFISFISSGPDLADVKKNVENATKRVGPWFKVQNLSSKLNSLWPAIHGLTPKHEHEWHGWLVKYFVFLGS